MGRKALMYGHLHGHITYNPRLKNVNTSSSFSLKGPQNCIRRILSIFVRILYSIYIHVYCLSSLLLETAVPMTDVVFFHTVF